MTNINTKNSGFTLTELSVVIAIIIIVASIFNTYLFRSNKAIKFVEEFNMAVDNAKKGIDGLNLELREATTAENGSYAIESAGEQSLIFYSDVDIDDQTERVRYFLDGKNLKKGVIEPTGNPATYNEANEVTSILSQYVENNAIPIFTYYDENNNLLSAPIPLTQIRLIHTYLEVNVTPERAPVNYAIENNVHLRNLKAEY